MSSAVPYTVVVPTAGRESLANLLAALAAMPSAAPEEIIIVDDRPDPDPPLAVSVRVRPVRILHSGAGGPAVARNLGWTHARTEWVVFLDDDVVPTPQWSDELQCDLVGMPELVGASQGRIVVDLPKDRAPTDLERGTAGLTTAWWATADMAYRHSALVEVGGFDEAFPRAYREDADLAVRVRSAGYRITTGTRQTNHPVRPDGFLASVRAQQGNADNAVLRRKYGRAWRRLIGEGRGRTGAHGCTTGAALAAVVTAPLRKSLLNKIAFLASAGAWVALTCDFAVRRIAAGPRTSAEIARMVVTSVLIPPVACWHRARGEVRQLHRRAAYRTPAAVLFDRDDTLIHDVAYNGNPERVHAIPAVREALDSLRVRGVPIGVITNQSAVARQMITPEQLAAVNAEVERQLGPFGTWQVCVHGEEDSCGCRKPAPGLIQRAASALNVESRACVVIGDTASDIGAAAAAGARGILVPTKRTRADEIAWARRCAESAPSVPLAVARVLQEGAR